LVRGLSLLLIGLGAQVMPYLIGIPAALCALCRQV